MIFDIAAGMILASIIVGLFKAGEKTPAHAPLHDKLGGWFFMILSSLGAVAVFYLAATQ